MWILIIYGCIYIVDTKNPYRTLVSEYLHMYTHIYMYK